VDIKVKKYEQLTNDEKLDACLRLACGIDCYIDEVTYWNAQAGDWLVGLDYVDSLQYGLDINYLIKMCWDLNIDPEPISRIEQSKSQWMVCPKTLGPNRTVPEHERELHAAKLVLSKINYSLESKKKPGPQIDKETQAAESDCLDVYYELANEAKKKDARYTYKDHLDNPNVDWADVAKPKTGKELGKMFRREQQRRRRAVSM